MARVNYTSAQLAQLNTKEQAATVSKPENHVGSMDQQRAGFFAHLLEQLPGLGIAKQINDNTVEVEWKKCKVTLTVKVKSIK